MTTPLLTHKATDGTALHAVVSLSAIRSLSATQIDALHSIEIDLVSQLLHYTPIHNAQLLIAAARGQIAHDLDLSTILDQSESATPTPLSDLPNADLSILKDVSEKAAKVFVEYFQVRTIEHLASFPPFVEAQRFLLPADDVFREPASAPEELIPKAIGSVESTVNYSIFAREHTLRLEGLELVYDAERKHFVDSRLATLFPVRGLGPILGRLKPETTASSNTPDLFHKFPRAPVPEPILHLGYVGKLTQQWVNMGTHLGEIVHSLALAPGESRNIAVIDWRRTQLTRRAEDTSVLEQLNHQLLHTRALDETTRSVAAEHLVGSTLVAAGTLATSAATVVGAGLAGGLAGSVPGAAIGTALGSIEPGLGNLAGALAGAVIGFGIGASVAAGGSALAAANGQLGVIQTDSSGDRSIIGGQQQNITEMTSQKSSSLRSLWSNIFVTDEQAESERLTTRNITNYNHSHALTIQYYEVLQHYRAEISLKAAEPPTFFTISPIGVHD